MATLEQNNVENKISKETIQSLVKETSLNCYGVIDFCKCTNKKGQQEDNIKVVIDNKQITVTAKIVVAKGLKITEIARSCQKAVRTILNIKYPHSVKEVNVYVEELYKA